MSTEPCGDDAATPDTELGDAVSGDAASSEPKNVLGSVHTEGFAQILNHFQCSIALTTYQAGHLVFLRSEGNLVNTHFRMFRKPMGLAVAPGRLALGTAQEIWEFHNLPAVLQKLEPRGLRDGCFLPRSVQFTGDIQIHEMAYVGPELWFVNTVFSCLCTRDFDNSFVPRWRPKFVTELAPGDRCHLNGLAVVNGKIKWVTALGSSNEPAGWRANKQHGGVLIDVESNEIVSRGLSMPHSPRWYADRLWILESGTGSLGTVDLESGRYEPLCHLPGFTRGLDFVGEYAFIGLSQVRETAIFSGLPITERLSQDQRRCGIWVVDIKSGQTVAFLQFEDAVQELFAVTAVRFSRFPDLIRDNRDVLGTSYVLPREVMSEVPAKLVAPGGSAE